MRHLGDILSPSIDLKTLGEEVGGRVHAAAQLPEPVDLCLQALHGGEGQALGGWQDRAAHRLRRGREGEERQGLRRSLEPRHVKRELFKLVEDPAGFE